MRILHLAQIVTGSLSTVLTVGVALAHEGHAHAAKAPAKKGAVVCPVMHSTITNVKKARQVLVNNTPVYLCCASCPDAFKKDPAKYLTGKIQDPVTHRAFQPTAKSPREERGGALFLFSSAKTRAQFDQHPDRFIHPHAG